MEKKSNVGRKVRITKFYDDSIGEIGVVEEDNPSECYIRVKMKNGDVHHPYRPGHQEAQCELLPEENAYHIDKLRDKKFWVSTPTEKDWQEVCEVFQRANIKWCSGDIATKFPHYHTADNGIQYDPGSTKYITHCKNSEVDVEYTKITAEQFIQSNQPTMNKNTQALEQIELLKAQIAKIEESLKEPVWEPKVGEWVVTTTRELNYTDNGSVGKIGTVYQVQEILEDKAGAWYRKTRGNTDGAKASSLRKATPEEIAANQQITVTIGTEGKVVTISKGKIVAPDGKTVDIANVNRICEVMAGNVRGFNGWTVTFSIVKVGCVEGITYDQLKAVQDAYHKING